MLVNGCKYLSIKVFIEGKDRKLHKWPLEDSRTMARPCNEIPGNRVSKKEDLKVLIRNNFETSKITFISVAAEKQQ